MRKAEVFLFGARSFLSDTFKTSLLESINARMAIISHGVVR